MSDVRKRSAVAEKILVAIVSIVNDRSCAVLGNRRFQYLRSFTKGLKRMPLRLFTSLACAPWAFGPESIHVSSRLSGSQM